MKYIKAYENSNLEYHLINSIKSDRLYKVKELIEKKGVDKNFKNKYLRTPLMTATILEKKDIVKYLLSINVDLNERDYRGDTALIFATNNTLSCPDILYDIIESGADWNIKDNNGKDFMEHILFSHIKNIIINKYPEKYDMYLCKKEAEKYNI